MAGFQGQSVEIPIGRAGLRTDLPNSLLGPDVLTRAYNIRYGAGLIEKEFGSRRWNQTVLPGGVLAGVDYQANDSLRRVMAVCNNGKVYKFPDAYSYAEVTAAGGAPATLSVANGANLVEGGIEETGNPRKLFVMTGNNPIQVISQDGTTRLDLASPIPDWAGTSNPIDGVIHRNMLFVWSRFGHTVFASSALDHEDFATDPLPYECYPGDGERIAGAFVFLKKLFIMKYPRGVFVLVDDDPDASNWYFAKVNGAVGGISSRAFVPIYDDVFFRNFYGSVSSVSSTDKFVDVVSGDLFAQQKIQRFVRENLTVLAQPDYHSIYYSQLQTAYMSFRTVTASANNLLCAVDFSDPSNIRISWIDKDQPTCLFLYRDSIGIERPFMGSNDGYIYQIDSENRWVGGETEASGTGYKMDFQTPYMDMGGTDVAMAGSVKQFERLEVTYLPEGDWNLSVDVFVDGRFIRTLAFKMSPDRNGSEFDTEGMTLDNGFMDADCEHERSLAIGASGKRISFRCYNDGVGENCRIVKLRCFFAPLGQEQKG